MKAEERYDSLFQYYGEKYGFDWLVLIAQATAESALNPNANSGVGAKGLCQFMDKTWSEWGDATPGIQEINLAKLNPYDPEDAIRAQAAYMAWLLKQVSGTYQTNGDIALALMAYNWGIGRVRGFSQVMSLGGVPVTKMPKETSDYVKRIFGILGWDVPTWVV